MRTRFAQSPSCLACGVVLAACLPSAAAQCVPLVSGEVKHKIGLPSSGWVALDVQAGVTEIDVTLTGKAEAEATAKSTGSWGSIAGAATSGVWFPQTLRISNFNGPGGGPLPDGILIESLGAGFRYVGPLGAAFAPCDANCDGSLNAFDIQPFRELLIGSGSPCAAGTGDVNRDGSVNAQDIQPFRDALLVGGC